MTLVFQLRNAAENWFVPDATSDELREWGRLYRTKGQPRRSLEHVSLWPHWEKFEGEIRLNAPLTEPPDFGSSGLGYLGILSANAIERTDGLWGMAEILPLVCRNADYSVMHPNVHRDILNMDASTYPAGDRLETQLAAGTLSAVYVYDLDVSQLNDVELFRLPQTTGIFCTQGFVDRLTEANLTGWTTDQVFPPTPRHLEIEARMLKRRMNLVRPGQLRPVPEISFGNKDLRTT